MALAERAAPSVGMTIDVADFIDQKPVGSFQIRIVLMCFAVLFVDGYGCVRRLWLRPPERWELAELLAATAPAARCSPAAAR